MKPSIASVLPLLHEAAFGALATHSTQLPGYPFTSVLPFMPDANHCPVFLISRLAEHTANLLADPRARFLVFRPQETSVLAGERLSLLGKVERIDAAPELAARYVRYQPEAEQYLALGDFAFFRLQPERARYIGGFAKMGWLQQDEWANLHPLPLTEEAGLLQKLADLQTSGVTLLGVDSYGADIKHVARGGKRRCARIKTASLSLSTGGRAGGRGEGRARGAGRGRARGRGQA